MGDPPSPLGGTARGSWGARPQARRQVCPHLCLLLFCSSLNFLLLGNEPRYPRRDSIQSRGLWVPEEHPDNRPDKGTLAAGTGAPERVCAPWFSCCAPTLAREEGEVAWMRTLVRGWSPARHGRTKELHLESRSGCGAAGDGSAHAGSSPGLCRSGPDQCWGSRAAHVQHLQPVPGGFPSWVVPARLSTLFAPCRDAARDAQGRDAPDRLPAGLMLLQGTLLLGECVESSLKRASPLRALTWDPGSAMGPSSHRNTRYGEASSRHAAWAAPPPRRCRPCGQKGLCHPSAMPTLPRDGSSESQA